MKFKQSAKPVIDQPLHSSDLLCSVNIYLAFLITSGVSRFAIELACLRCCPSPEPAYGELIASLTYDGAVAIFQCYGTISCFSSTEISHRSSFQTG
jgi:hypothetical protein